MYAGSVDGDEAGMGDEDNVVVVIRRILGLSEGFPE
jgi:hypothetical protein